MAPSRFTPHTAARVVTLFGGLLLAGLAPAAEQATAETPTCITR